MLLNTHVYILHFVYQYLCKYFMQFFIYIENWWFLVSTLCAKQYYMLWFNHCSSNANVPFNIASIDMYSIKRSLKLLTRIRSNTRMMQIYHDFISKRQISDSVWTESSPFICFINHILFIIKQEIFGKHDPLWIRARHFIQVSHFSSLELIGLSWSPDVSRPSLRTHGWLHVNFHIFYISRTT